MNEQDIKIIELIKKNDSFALDLIYDSYAKVIYSTVISKCKNKNLADDLFQKTFEKIAEKRSKLVSCTNLKSYLARMAANEVYDHFRRNKKAISPEDLAVYESQKAQTSYSEKWLEKLRNELVKLPEDQNKVVMLKVFEKYTFKDIADLLGISANTAASRYRYALINLKKSLNFGELNDEF